MQYPSQPCHPAPSIMPPTRLPRQCLPAFQEARPGPLPGTGHRERGPSPSRARRGNGDRMKEAPADSTGPGLHGKDADPGDTPHRGPVPLVGRACWGTAAKGSTQERKTGRGVPETCSRFCAMIAATTEIDSYWRTRTTELPDPSYSVALALLATHFLATFKLRCEKRGRNACPWGQNPRQYTARLESKRWAHIRKGIPETTTLLAAFWTPAFSRASAKAS